jgi:hypothetical protein
MHEDTVKEGGHSMSEESGQIARSENGTGLLFRIEDYTPSVLASKFAFQMERTPKKEKWIARFSAQAILAGFYLQHLEDYERMFKDVFQVDRDEYSKLSEQEAIKVKQREKENDKWLVIELAESIYSLGQRIVNLRELDVLCKLLRDTQRKITLIKEHYEDYTMFDAQLSFFDEPMKFVLRINEKLDPFIELIEEFEDKNFVVGRSIYIRRKPTQVQSKEDIVVRGNTHYITPQIQAVPVG